MNTVNNVNDTNKISGIDYKSLTEEINQIKDKCEKFRVATSGDYYGCIKSYEKTPAEFRLSFREVSLFAYAEALDRFGRELNFDDYNKRVFKILAAYFSRDGSFIDRCLRLGVPNPTLKKGLMLIGDVGTGKTTLLKAFSRNQLLSYGVMPSKEISALYEENGLEGLADMVKPYYVRVDGVLHNAAQRNFRDRFKPFVWQRELGLCIDDLGAEDNKSYMGNKRNVIADIIESRYDMNHVGIWLHVTTNLTEREILERYGKRVLSRLREIVNFIPLNGQDRRK